ncbi:MAG TPA: metalloregulator ArsR/SmtB family transcription factor [Vicinamibacterales bacterium]|jgi:DNA-binding transcriptional ArsR family regulator|nr:metalloregulator ArsR/SmtB family transcription factor [Vicinamibacterales bacterium]
MPKPTKRNLTSAALLFAALGDPTRLMLVRQLSEGGPASISVLAEQQDMTRQGVTKHLQVLAAAGIIDGSRQGREQVWTLNPKRLAEGRRHLDVIAAGWDEALERFKKLVEE